MTEKLEGRDLLDHIDGREDISPVYLREIPIVELERVLLSGTDMDLPLLGI